MRYGEIEKVIGEIRFLNGPDLERALEIMDTLSDEELNTKDRAIAILKEAKLYRAASELIGMTQDEWEDFVVNNLGEDREEWRDETKIKSDIANMGVTPEGRAPNDGGTGQFGDSSTPTHPEYEKVPLEELSPGVATPEKQFEIREARLKKPSNYDTARKIANPYPTVEATFVTAERGLNIKWEEQTGGGVLADYAPYVLYVLPADEAWEWDISYPDELGAPGENIVAGSEDTKPEAIERLEIELEALIKKPGTESNYPTVDAAVAEDLAKPAVAYPEVDAVMEEGGIVEDNDHLEQLGIESPDEFGVKFKGQLDTLAEEHDLGDLLGYALTDYGIIIFGSENVLKLDYAMEEPDVKPVYYFEEDEELEGEPGAEPTEIEVEDVETNPSGPAEEEPAG